MSGCNIAPYKRLQCVLCCQCNYTAHDAKQHTGLYRGFSSDCTRSTATDTRPTQQAIAPPATRWRAYTRPDALNLYQIPPPRRTLHRPAQPPIIIRYIRGQTMPARRGLDASHARRLEIWHPAPGGAVQRQGHGERRGTIGGYRRISFRAFAR